MNKRGYHLVRSQSAPSILGDIYYLHLPCDGIWHEEKEDDNFVPCGKAPGQCRRHLRTEEEGERCQQL